MQGQGSDYKQQVLQAVNIVELINQTVALKHRGKDHIGLCPFHNEKTPSFHVSEARQFFYCYGCKAGGNAIDFVMKRDRIEFIEALKQLGQKAGIPMPQFGGDSAKAGERQLLLDAQSAACSHFQKMLGEPRGQVARDYLAKRGFNQETITKFQIGYAPDGWDHLLTSPFMRKFQPQQLNHAGLLKAREGGSGFYDTFRNRLMFPIRDEMGRVIAFGGRVMPGSQDPAKYLNSPETPIFSKSRCAFGMDMARQRVVEKRAVAIVEGYTDVIMAHQYGVSNVVSVLGTALTPQHVNLLRRFADRLVLLFDPDTAGDLAVDRAVELFLTQPIEVVIATLPDKLDPDEYLLKFGAEAFDKLLGEQTTDALSYKWKQMVQKFRQNADDMTGQQKAVEEYLTMLAGARAAGPIDQLRWGAAITRVSRLTDIPVEQLNRRFAARRTLPPTHQRPAMAQGSDNDLSTAQPEAPAPTPRPILPPAQETAERHLLGALLLQPKAWNDVQSKVGIDDFADPVRRRLAERYWDHHRHEGEPVFSEFLSTLQDAELTQTAVELAGECEKTADLNTFINSSLEYLAEVQRKRDKVKIIVQTRRNSDTEENNDDQNDLLRRLTEQARKGNPWA